MIELLNNQLTFRFPEVHQKATCHIDFQRTLRIPDDNGNIPYPPVWVDSLWNTWTTSLANFLRLAAHMAVYLFLCINRRPCGSIFQATTPVR